MARIKKQKIKVSVVVPIFNVEKYLPECIESILKQTLKEIEIILIDDGSPDQCGKIIDEYAKKDTRIIAIHQKNHGYSYTVNYGISIARGEYIGVIESDDWIESEMYEDLFANAKKNKTDVTKGLFYIYNSLATHTPKNIIYTNPNGMDLRLAPNRVFSADDWPKIMGFHASLWSAIYKSSFIKKIKLPETAGASYQDLPFITEVYCRAKRISVVKKPFVHWRNDVGQKNSTQASGKKLLFMAKNSLLSLKILKKYNKLEIMKESFFLQVLWANFEFFKKIDKKYKPEYFKILSEIFSEIKKDKNFHYLYFSEYEKNKIGYFLEDKGYKKILRKELLHDIKLKTIRCAMFLLPTYRMMRFLKDQNQDLIRQIEALSDEIRTMQNK